MAAQAKRRAEIGPTLAFIVCDRCEIEVFTWDLILVVLALTWRWALYAAIFGLCCPSLPDAFDVMPRARGRHGQWRRKMQEMAKNGIRMA